MMVSVVYQKRIPTLFCPRLSRRISLNNCFDGKMACAHYEGLQIGGVICGEVEEKRIPSQNCEVSRAAE